MLCKCVVLLRSVVGGCRLLRDSVVLIVIGFLLSGVNGVVCWRVCWWKSVRCVGRCRFCWLMKSVLCGWLRRLVVCWWRVWV